MSLCTKCVTLLRTKTQRPLFVDCTMKFPLMSELVIGRDNSKVSGKRSFSSSAIAQTGKKAIHSDSKHQTEAQSPKGEARSPDILHSPEKGAMLEKAVKDMIANSVKPIANNITKGITAKINKKPHLNEHFEPSFDYDAFFDVMIQKKKDDYSYRHFRKVNRNAVHFPKGTDYTYAGQQRNINIWCSNDYLGMSRHKAVVEAAKLIIDENGVGSGGTRNISGTSLYHGMLEEMVADWHQKEAGLLFTSCFVANDTALYTLGNSLPGCIIYSDAGNHASMIHGIRTSGATRVVFRHNDPLHLEELLQKSDPNVPKIVAFETVHSMSGAVCPLEQLCDVAHKYGALTFVDEVHAVGLYGKYGAGIGERDGCLHKMDIISGTLAKAIGCIGGYLAGKESLIDSLRSYGTGFIFTTALPPDKVYAALTSIQFLKSKEGQKLREVHQAKVNKLRARLIAEGFPVEFSPSHIIPVMAGSAAKCTQVSNYLQQVRGIYIQSINYPTVPRGQEKLRIAPTPYHTEDMMDDLVHALKEAWAFHKLPRHHLSGHVSNGKIGLHV